ncbi:hypothetical protein [Bartonella sp. AR 15-3]|uniref:hypothetical protein n=1 Tax=Bartonella sp. AR 15-3 TaxID=545617 RepID=UPI00099A3135|nr:hypothetical protein [Bartonella sp. AR 15-3]OPB31195.1 Coiled stalk of trimeric autotransporter adhesin [Bartonella sp. AR 15-3]
MKRSDLILKRGDLRGHSFSGFSPLLKAASLGTVMTALLSSVSPVIASTFSPTEQQTTIQRQKDLNSSKSTDGSGVLSSNILREGSEGRNGSVHFSSNQFCGVDDIVVSNTFDSKKIDTGRTITEGNNEKFIASRQFASCQLERPAIWTVDGRNTTSDVLNNTMSDVLNFVPSYAFKRNKASGLEWGDNAVAKDEGSIAIGHGAHANGRKNEKPDASIAIAIGDKSTVAIGSATISIGANARTHENGAIAIGARTEVTVVGGVALGTFALADVAGGVAGYDPVTGKATTNEDRIWVSNTGAFSIGGSTNNSSHPERNKTRQIINLAAGTEDTDAVNIAQLKALRQWTGDEIAKVGGGWNLSVNGQGSANISSGSTVDFSSTGNLEISKDQDNKVTFDLAKSITVDKLTVAEHTLDQTGLVFKDGPSITVSGIDVASKKITGVADGVADSDAVNKKQLNEVEKLATKSWQLSIGGTNATDVAPGSTVDFSSTDNLKISKDQDNKVTFDLAKSITVDKLTVAGHTLDQTGLSIKGGPSVTAANGINAGHRRILGVADGFLDDDAVNKKQLNVVEELVKKGWRLSVNGGEDLYVGAGNKISFINGDQNLSILGDNARSITFDLAQDISVNSVILGRQILNKDGLTLEDGTSITTNGIAAGGKKISGVLAGTEDTDAVNFSQLNAVKNELEKNNWIQQDSATGIITIGAQVGGTAIDFANKDGEGRILSGLKDGAVSETSNAAVTGNQLYTTNSQIAQYLGGGARYEDGQWIDPTFTLNVVQEDGSTQEKEYKNVADALKDVSTSFTNVENVFENGIVQQEESEDESGRITIGLQTGGTEVSLLNKDGSRRVLSGLADGDLSEGSTEAVTGSQLFKVDSDLKATKDTVTEISTTVDGLSTSMTAVQGDVSKIAKNTSKYLGGGANILDGTAPTYRVQGKDYQNVGTAFTGVDGSITDIYSKIASVAGVVLLNKKQVKMAVAALR